MAHHFFPFNSSARELFTSVTAVLFDFNGVILDDEELHFQAFQIVCEQRKIYFGRAEYTRFCQGKSDVAGFTALQKENPALQAVNLSNLLLEKQTAYRCSFQNSPPKPILVTQQLISLLQKEKYHLGLVTATSREDLAYVLPGLGLETTFDVIISCDDVKKGKPDPEGYLLAATRLHVLPSQCLVVEDSLSNLQAVIPFGMKTLAVVPGSLK